MAAQHTRAYPGQAHGYAQEQHAESERGDFHGSAMGNGVHRREPHGGHGKERKMAQRRCPEIWMGHSAVHRSDPNKLLILNYFTGISKSHSKSLALQIPQPTCSKERDSMGRRIVAQFTQIKRALRSRLRPSTTAGKKSDPCSVLDIRGKTLSSRVVECSLSRTRCPRSPKMYSLPVDPRGILAR